MDPQKLSALFDLTGRTAIVTGGTRGIGRAIAEGFISAGANVVVASRKADACAETETHLNALATSAVDRGNRALGVATHMGEIDALNALVAATVERFGGVDIVVNNAGVAVSGSIDDTSEEDWHWIVDINLLGVARGCRVFTPLFKQQGSGWFVNVASVAGLIHPPHMSAYNTTKAAVVALSETLYAELQPHGIGTSVVCPAFFRTNLANTARAANADMANVTRHLVNKAKVGAEEIAAQVFAGVEKGEFRIITHPRERRFYYIKRVLPFEWFGKGVILEAERMLSSGKKS